MLRLEGRATRAVLLEHCGVELAARMARFIIASKNASVALLSPLSALRSSPHHRAVTVPRCV